MTHLSHPSHHVSRRGFLALGSAGLLTACATGLGNNGVGSPAAAQIDSRVDAQRSFLQSQFPGTADLEQRAAGVLYMPLLTEAGLGIGGGYGRGALRIKGVTVDYYSATRASFGLQIGAQQYAHVLYFMSEDALANFRRSSGWAAGADLRYATFQDGATIGKDTTELSAPVEAFVFGQQGLIVGATLSGLKYSRIIP
jgi:lipid-binding SYLF domain-containing protein